MLFIDIKTLLINESMYSDVNLNNVLCLIVLYLHLYDILLYTLPGCIITDVKGYLA